MIIDTRALSSRDAYHLLSACVVPRPIAWVTSVSPDGVVNAAPFSFFNAVSSHPPVIMISVGQRAGEQKDTAKNIRDAREFVVNIVDEELAAKMNITAGNYPRTTSEISEAGLTLRPSTKVKTPGIDESPVHLECVLREWVELGSSDVIFGDVMAFHVRDDLMTDGRIDPMKLRAVGRLSGSWYCRTTDLFEMRRP